MAEKLTETGTSRYVQAGATRVHYNEAGRGPVLIFCAGQGPGTSAWVVYHRVIDELAKHFRCLLLDQPGYGKSDAVTVKGESRSTMYARTVHDFMNALDIDRATIVDMSFGAQTGQVFGIEYADRVDKLVLHASGILGPTIFASQPMEGVAAMAATFAHPSLDGMRKMMNSFLFEGHRYSDEDLGLAARLDAWLARPELEQARSASDRIQRDMLKDLEKIACPVLQIHGRHDRVVPLEAGLQLFNHLPDSMFVVLARCGHWAPFERPREFSRLVVDFISNGG